MTYSPSRQHMKSQVNKEVYNRDPVLQGSGIASNLSHRKQERVCTREVIWRGRSTRKIWLRSSYM